MTLGLPFAEIEGDLVDLRDRLLSQGRRVKEFYIDNCCSWKTKLQQVFGDDLVVHLDIFHAVKRFGEKIPKRHPLRRECLREWQVVFRDLSDCGEKRHLTTPSPSVMESNLDSFIVQWKDSE